MPSPVFSAAHTADLGRTGPAAPRPLVAAVRDGLVESVHYGSAIALAADGSVAATAGEPLAPFYPRSALKPLQAVAMVRAGLELPADLLALAAASHSGVGGHRDGALRILELHGLGPQPTSRTAPTSPTAPPSARTGCAPAAGPRRSPRTVPESTPPWPRPACINGWPVRGYLDPSHPLQQLVAPTVTELTGEEPGRTEHRWLWHPAVRPHTARHGPGLRPDRPGRFPCSCARRRAGFRKRGSRRRARHAAAPGNGGG